MNADLLLPAITVASVAASVVLSVVVARRLARNGVRPTYYAGVAFVLGLVVSGAGSVLATWISWSAEDARCRQWIAGSRIISQDVRQDHTMYDLVSPASLPQDEPNLRLKRYHYRLNEFDVGAPAACGAVVALLGALGATRRYRKRRRTGLCINCGYDLRASVGRCPECGMEFKAGDHAP